ncbi:LysR family transcriptional regulator [Martelella mediterranea]|uniref:CysJI operon transcriptional activator n=1 Tax=Martelella mediterranea DSM 17316 TaxID=1122214 RepID=A0A1U9Z2A4_9HYPH|nr:LysR family transcriptional regulator [Martelella mediterranea]AQZ51821.1 CysJI operon transcriptional activator [Martelella mediterranea DSM 17316]
MTLSLQTPLPVLDNDILRTFVAIAETGSFSGAAERVFRTPSAVSMQIKRLEEVVGASLFVRDSRSVRLTRSGETLLSYARRMLALSNEAMSRFRHPDMHGVVRLGATDDIGERVLPTVLKRFAEAFPSVMVDVTIDNSNGLAQRLREQRLDLTLLNSGDLPGRDEDGELIMRERLVWVGAKCGTAYLKEPLPVSMWEQSCCWRHEAVRKLAEAGRPYRVAYLSATTMVQRAAVLSDLAVAPMAAYYVTDDMEVLGPDKGLPELGLYDIRLKFSDQRGELIEAVADAIRHALQPTQLANRVA